MITFTRTVTSYKMRFIDQKVCNFERSVAIKSTIDPKIETLNVYSREIHLSKTHLTDFAPTQLLFYR